MTTKGSVKDANPVKLANMVYNNLPASTRAMLPQVQANSQSANLFARAMLDYPQVLNDVTAAINKIAYQFIRSDDAVNPLERFVKGEVMPGYAIEHDFVDYLETRDYEWCNDFAYDLLSGVQAPTIVPLYYSQNFKKQVPACLNADNMANSMKDWSGLNSMIDAVVGKIEASFTNETYLYTKSLFSDAYNKGYMIPIKVNSFDLNNYTKEDLERNAAIFRATYEKFKIQSRDYNYLGVMTRTRDGSINISTTCDYMAANDVNVLASSFNMDKSNFLGKVISLPDLGEKMDHVIAMMFDDDFIQIYWNYKRMDTPFYNPANMMWNYFYNAAGIFSYCIFANCVVFVDELKTIDSVTITASQKAPKCAYTQIEYEVATSGEGGFTNKCNWSISGNTSKKTKISPFGRLWVAKDESAGTISVTATSVQDPSKTSTVDVTITS